MAEDKKVTTEKTKATPVKTKKNGVSISKFLKETMSELKKVVWPTRRQLIINTLIVIAASIAMSLYVAGFDTIFSYADRVLLRK